VREEGAESQLFREVGIRMPISRVLTVEYRKASKGSLLDHSRTQPGEND